MRHCLRCRNSHREHGEDSLKFSAEGVAPPASFVRWRAFSPAFIVRACRTIPLSPERAAPAGLRGGSSMGYPRDRCRNTRRGSAEPNCIHSPGCRVRMGVYTNPGSSPAGTCCPPCRWTPTLPAALRHSGHAGAPCSCLRKRIRRGIWRPHGGGLGSRIPAERCLPTRLRRARSSRCRRTRRQCRCFSGTTRDPRRFRRAALGSGSPSARSRSREAGQRVRQREEQRESFSPYCSKFQNRSSISFEFTAGRQEYCSVKIL